MLSFLQATNLSKSRSKPKEQHRKDIVIKTQRKLGKMQPKIPFPSSEVFCFIFVQTCKDFSILNLHNRTSFLFLARERDTFYFVF